MDPFDNTQKIALVPDPPKDRQVLPWGKGRIPALPEASSPPSQLGSLSWTAMQMFGGEDEMMDMLVSAIQSQGAGADEKWVRLCQLWGAWGEEWEKGRLRRKPTLNDLAEYTGLETAMLVRFLAANVQALYGAIGQVKASMAAPLVVRAAIEAAMDPEYGGKDRELVLKIAGILQQGPGTVVNVQQNNQTVVGQAALKAPLKQFEALDEEIDLEVREGMILDGEVVDVQ